MSKTAGSIIIQEEDLRLVIFAHISRQSKTAIDRQTLRTLLETVLTSEEAIQFLGKAQNTISLEQFENMFDLSSSTLQEKLIINYAQIKIDEAQSDAMSMTIASYDHIVAIVMTSERDSIPTIQQEDDDL